MNGQKILVITPCPTDPPVAGNCRRIANLIDTLLRMGHDVHVLYLPHFMLGLADTAHMRRRWGERLHVGRPEWAWIPGSVRNRLLWIRERALERAGYSPQTAGTDRTGFDRLTRRDWEEQTRTLWQRYRFDTVILEYILVSRVLVGLPDSVHKIIDTLDIFAGRHERIRNVPKSGRWFSTTPEDEALALRRADVILAIQDEEADYFRSVQPKRVVTVGHLADRVQAAGEPPGPPSIVMIGSENPSNQYGLAVFLERTWPLVRAHIPDARLRLVGKIGDGVSADHPGVERLGMVDDTAAAYGRGHVVVNPVLEGTGLPIKSIEALMHGKALVTTPWAAASLDDGAGSAFLARATPEEMAAAIVHLLKDPGARTALAEAAFRYATRYVERQERSLEVALTRR